MCKQSTIYEYSIADTTVVDKLNRSIMPVIAMITFIVTIATCQTLIEAKRFFLNRIDKKADTLALTATKQLEDAMLKLNCLIKIQKLSSSGTQQALPIHFIRTLSETLKSNGPIRNKVYPDMGETLKTEDKKYSSHRIYSPTENVKEQKKSR